MTRNYDSIICSLHTHKKMFFKDLRNLIISKIPLN